ncbi:MAG: hypothetical protein AAGF11_09935 [Myxococcota bacterium]
MSSRLDLSPEQLDRLEDALEDLEQGPPPSTEDDDAVAQRLVEFRELLQLSREAMPLQEVPAGVLDGVLAEARQVAVASPASAERRSWWSRWRLGIWLPTLAFAGSAALLLVMLLPLGADQAEPASPSTVAADQVASAPAEQATESDDRRLADAEPLRRRGESRRSSGQSAAQGDALGQSAARGEGVVIGERGPPLVPGSVPAPATSEPEPEPYAEDTAEQRSARKSSGSSSKPAPKPKSKSKSASRPTKPAPGAGGGKSKAGGKGNSGGLPLPSGGKNDKKNKAPAEPSKPSQADLWPEVLEGDALRRQGNCGLAKMRYRKARKAEQPPVRARALAGEGLCEYVEDRFGKAKKLFAQARAADSGVGGFIEAELSQIEQAQAPAQAAPPVQSKE